MNDTKPKEKLKTLGQGIPENLYWKFKEIAARRKETMNEAVESAVRLYVDFDGEQN